MHAIGHGRRVFRAILLGLTALAIGAVFGTAHDGGAAIAVKPTNTAPPAISGTAKEGSTLTSSTGTWDGSATITYAYAWSRCDKDGGSCAAISGATANTYVLKNIDVGATLRVAVTATNADGSATSTSVPTAVVAGTPVAPVTGCPAGTGVMQIADVSPPARLQLDQQTIAPGIVTPSATSVQVHFRVTACGGRPVQGALVYATAVPYNQYSIAPEGVTGADGGTTMTMNQLRGFPASRQQQLLVVFGRARKPGEPLTAGISTRLLVSFPVSLK
jgi:hypothetical protein